jgi:probable rRNA maturation factor
MKPLLKAICPMINLEIKKEFQDLFESSSLKLVVSSTLRHLSVPENASITILITTDQQIHQLNRDFRGVDTPTDVLAFPAGHRDPEDGTIYLGDVIISHPRASHQARQRGHPVIKEIQLLIIHGILHLLGYDHEDPEGKEQMWERQEFLLDQLGNGSEILDED